MTHPQPQMSGSPYFEVITNLTRQDISGGCKYIALHQILIKFKLFYNYLCSEFLVSIYPIISHLIFKLRNYKHGKFSLDSCILSLTFIMSVLNSHLLIQDLAYTWHHNLKKLEINVIIY